MTETLPKKGPKAVRRICLSATARSGLKNIPLRFHSPTSKDPGPLGPGSTSSLA